MPNIILYVTRADADEIRKWLNAERCIAWIVKREQHGHEYTWQAVDAIDEVLPQEYCLWHKQSGPLNIPSGSLAVPDERVRDPYAGWMQRLDTLDATRPWFGSNLPGPYHFTFRERSRRSPEALGRSEFSWLGDRYRNIGKAASAEASNWWRRLARFVRSSSKTIPLPYPEGIGRHVAFAFPEAHEQILCGVPVDENP
jgi:hypothetical protein